MNIARAINGDSSHDVLMRKLEAIGAKANARTNKIDRDPIQIDHLACSYSEKPVLQNGATRDLHVQLLGQDAYVQKIGVTIGLAGFTPAHTHPHYCVCHIKSGSVIDSVRDMRFEKGDWYMVKAHEVHSAQSMSGAEITVYNTFHEKIADSILSNKGYDLSKARFDRVKISES